MTQLVTRPGIGLLQTCHIAKVYKTSESWDILRHDKINKIFKNVLETTHLATRPGIGLPETCHIAKVYITYAYFEMKTSGYAHLPRVSLYRLHPLFR